MVGVGFRRLVSDFAGGGMHNAGSPKTRRLPARPRQNVTVTNYIAQPWVGRGRFMTDVRLISLLPIELSRACLGAATRLRLGRRFSEKTRQAAQKE